MKWSWKIGEYAGIGVYIHATFLLIIGWVALSHWIQGNSLSMMLAGLGFILALFGCVLLHEFGHALTAKKYGIKTRDITLLPIGGVARLERMPDDPKQELWVALAGPAVNVVIAAMLFVWLKITSGLEPFNNLSVTGGSFAERLMIVNIFLVAFNILPAFPMDGGRVLRALLAMRMEYTRATQIAASIGQGMAFLFGFIGLFTNPFLLFIALFVWIGAAQEASMVQMKSAVGGIPVKLAMLTDFRTLAPDDTLTRAIELILSGSQQDFPVVENGRVVGVLTRNDMLVALAKKGQNALVADVMQREFQVVDSAEMLETAFTRLQTCACHTLPVVSDQQLIGLVTMDNVGEFLMIQSALRGGKGSGMTFIPNTSALKS
ncbi:MAG: site-2 protease family protein [candidate division KSB1 bacterium]|nr:site-2 protease family protein [candidate division KSB1 bacterium]MDZ7304331.1 site-2 protease family protein [candidate division KSB1 bacterium]MDZ7313607.1 site-2 protease family protein [candidate division KSB1 bacterium]